MIKGRKNPLFPRKTDRYLECVLVTESTDKEFVQAGKTQMMNRWVAWDKNRLSQSEIVRPSISLRLISVK